jgi:hypothetical protein
MFEIKIIVLICLLSQMVYCHQDEEILTRFHNGMAYPTWEILESGSWIPGKLPPYIIGKRVYFRKS